MLRARKFAHNYVALLEGEVLPPALEEFLECMAEDWHQPIRTFLIIHLMHVCCVVKWGEVVCVNAETNIHEVFDPFISGFVSSINLDMFVIGDTSGLRTTMHVVVVVVVEVFINSVEFLQILL